SLPSAPRAVDVGIDSSRRRENTQITAAVPDRPRGYARDGSPPTPLFLAAIFGVLLLAWAFVFATSQLVGHEPATEDKGPRLQKAGGAAVASSYEITSDPPGALIVVDGDDTGLTTPASMQDLPEGPHKIQLLLRYHESAVREVHIEDGGSLAVE